MSENTNIEWCDSTFNPWMGCTKVSPACDHCYAERDTSRFKIVQWGPGQPRKRTEAANWKNPLRWNAAHDKFFAEHGRRRRVFCASLSDVFDNEIDPSWRADLFDLIRATPNLDWLLLTKRIGNVQHMVEAATCHSRLPGNVWLGITICNQTEADRDIPKLLSIQAAVRFLSMEPLLGPVKLNSCWISSGCGFGNDSDPATSACFGCANGYLGTSYGDHCAWPSAKLDWIIVGGESGPLARPMHPGWARSLREQCRNAGLPFLFKQWGEWSPEDLGEQNSYRDTAGILPSGEFLLMSQGYVPPFDDMDRLKAANYVRLDGRVLMERVGKKVAGRQLDGRTHDEYPKAAV